MVKVPKIRRKKDLEIFLEQVPKIPSPDPKMEQYKTPAPISADIIFNAFNTGDIEDKHVVDLGCGTGIFAVGAKVMGAKKVQGIDIDVDSINSAKNFSQEHGLKIEFEVMNVKDVNWTCDTVLQNPPFGAQMKKADRIFLETAAKMAEVIYTIHNANTGEFVKMLVEKLGCSVGFEQKYIFKIEHTFDFHTKPQIEHTVTLFKLIRKGLN